MRRWVHPSTIWRIRMFWESDMQVPQKQQQSGNSFFAELSAAAQAKAEAERATGQGSGGGWRSTGLEVGSLEGEGRSRAGQVAQPMSLPPQPAWPAEIRRERARGRDVSRIDAGEAWPQEMQSLQEIRDLRDLGGLRPIQD